MAFNDLLTTDRSHGRRGGAVVKVRRGATELAQRQESQWPLQEAEEA